MTVCGICENADDNISYKAREMMFGYRDEFEYFQCSNCGCLQIREIPNNLSAYYPNQYYSFQEPEPSKQSALKSFLKRRTAQYRLKANHNIIGMLASKVYRAPVPVQWCQKAGVKLESHICDVGSGTGRWLLEFHRLGFSHLEGIDPLLSHDVSYAQGITIARKDIRSVEKQFDFVMLHNSFEHMPQPSSVFRELYRILKPSRYLLIRTPVASSFAWRKYNVNWVQLDAPRHLFIHTPETIQILAHETGFRLAEIDFDSTEFQFWGSEQYLHDIPLQDSRSYSKNQRESLFSKTDIKSFRRKARQLNAKGDGDSACFYLYKE